MPNRVIFVVVAAGTTHRHGHPDSGSGLYAIDHILGLILLGNRATFEIDHVVAIESGGKLLLRRCVRQQVAGQLLGGELVKRQVAIEGTNHPIAPVPHIAVAVDVIPVRIGVARQIEPLHRHSLAVTRRAKQPVHLFFVSVRRGI